MNILYRKNKSLQGSHPNLEKIIKESSSKSTTTSTSQEQNHNQKPRATVPYRIAIPFYKNSSKNNDKQVYHSEPPVKLTAIRRRRSISENNRRNFLTIERKSLIEHRRYIEEDYEEEDEEDYEVYNCENSAEDEPDTDTNLKKLKKHTKVHERKSSPITLFNKKSSTSKVLQKPPPSILYTPNPGIPAPLHDTLTKSFSVDNSSNLSLSSSPILSPRRHRLLFNPKRNNATLVTNMLDIERQLIKNCTHNRHHHNRKKLKNV